MSKQIAIRLPDDMVEFIDDFVARGGAASRAEVVARALGRERRRQVAARDAAILAEVRADGDGLDRLADYAAHVSLDDLE